MKLLGLIVLVLALVFLTQSVVTTIVPPFQTESPP